MITDKKVYLGYLFYKKKPTVWIATIITYYLGTYLETWLEHLILYLDF